MATDRHRQREPNVSPVLGIPRLFLPLSYLFVISIFFLLIAVKPLKAVDDIAALIGPKDALLVTAPDGSVVFSANETARRIPASTIKLFTSLAALHYLGPDFRFATDFFTDKNQNLKIKGYGDPLLISEVVDEVAQALAREFSRINTIVLDDTFFSQPIVIPGRSASNQPYDAPNGALCANFNTVQFKKNPVGRYESTEPQTPLVPFVLPKLRVSGIQSGRIVLSHLHNENVLYVGHLFLHFLNQHGIQCRGTVQIGTVNTVTDRHILHYKSPFTLEDVIQKLLKHSNNYIANQVLIAVGATIQGPPGDLQKGVQAVRKFAHDILAIKDFHLVEGSGISRKNRISARELVRVVNAFLPYRHLMTKKGRVYYKTGSLFGISTRAGFIEREKGGWYRFVVMMNTSGRSAEHVVRTLLKHLP